MVKVLKVVNNGALAKQIILNTSSNDNIDNNPIVSQTAAFPNQKQQQQKQQGSDNDTNDSNDGNNATTRTHAEWR